jgi:hypothetical protein
MNGQDMDSIKKTARLAGLLYLLASIPGPFGLIYVPGQLLVPGDATATADRLRSSGTLLHMGIAADLVSSAAFIFVVLTLYRLFKSVGESAALSMLILFVLSVPIMFLNVLNDLAALELARGAAFLSSFDAHQRDALAYLFLTLHGKGVSVAQIFWGLWLFPFGLLVIRSGFIPRFLGVLLMAAGVGNVISSLTALLLPQYGIQVSSLTTILGLCELPIIFWLLIWGARPQRVAAHTS